ncbi:carboxypeptidase regulatory-like domain-containing protein [Methanobacterium aggregans]|uniref:carboxypeptidase regulatory-like domain-containing protein n=1 Tax=Methanobacterium aggregans TaxID=1615586 RepID=UPI003210D0FF
MKIQVKMVLLACVLVLALSGTASASDTNNTTIYSDNSSLNSDQSPALNTNSYPDPIVSGVVMDNSTHMGVANVSVKIKDQNNNLVAETLTNTDGTYSVGFINSNTVFNVITSKLGYLTLAKEITVNSGPNPTDPNLYGTANFQLIAIPYNGSASSTIINIGALANILLELNVGKTSAWVDTQNIPYSEAHGTPLEVKLFTGNLLEGLLNVDSVGGQGYVTGGISPSNLPVLLGILGINAGLLEANANSTVDPSQATGSSSLASLNLSPLLLVQILNLGLINSNSSVIPDFNNGALTSSANCGTVQDISLLNGLLVIHALNINATASANGTPGGAHAKFDWNTADIELAGVSILNELKLKGVVELPGVLRISLGTGTEITSPDGTYAKASGSALSLDLLDVIPGSFLTLNIGTVMAEASVPVGGLNPTTNDLSVRKTVDKNVANYEELLNYTVTAQNNGPDNATNVLVHDVLPAGLTWISDDSNGAYNPTTGTWTIGNLPNGTNAILHILTQITTSNTTITNLVNINNNTYDQNNTNNQANATVDVGPAADLSITKTVDNTNPNYLQNVIYTLTAHNNGPNNATGVTVTEKLPNGLRYISDDSNGAYDPTTGTWTIGDLANGANAVLHITAQTILANIQINNTATINNNTYDQNNTNNQANATVNIGPAADLGINITVDRANPQYLDYVTFTLTAHNYGPESAPYVKVYNTLPNGLRYISDDSNGAFNSTTGLWTVGYMANGASAVMHITAQAMISNAQLTDTATITDPDPVTLTGFYDPNPNNNQASVTIEPYSKGIPTNPGTSVNTRTTTKVAEETKTVPMLPTGSPINLMVMAILLTIAGTICPKIKG